MSNAARNYFILRLYNSPMTARRVGKELGVSFNVVTGVIRTAKERGEYVRGPMPSQGELNKGARL